MNRCLHIGLKEQYHCLLTDELIGFFCPNCGNYFWIDEHGKTLTPSVNLQIYEFRVEIYEDEMKREQGLLDE